MLVLVPLWLGINVGLGWVLVLVPSWLGVLVPSRLGICVDAVVTVWMLMLAPSIPVHPNVHR